jgi:photosystem II stability/assembly factor-like uncharacterized protein
MNILFLSKVKNMRLIMAQNIDKTKKDSGLIRILFLFILVVLNAPIIFPQWISTNGPGGGEITAFTAIGNNLIVGTYTAGPFLSSNNGLSWTLVNNGLPANTGVSALTVIGNNILAGIEDPSSTGLGLGIYLSTNNGSNWSQVNNGLTSTYIHAFVVNGNNIFAGTDNYYGGGGGVFLSTNDGSNWTQVNNGLPSNITVYALAVSGNNIFAGTTGGSPTGPGGIYLSTDNGASWALSNNGLKYIHGITPPITSSSKNISSQFKTNKFSLLPMRPTVYALTVNGNNIFAGTTEGVYISSDYGADWSLVTDGLIYGEYVYSITIGGDNIFAGTSGGVYLSTNNGVLWTEVIDGLPSNSPVNALFISGKNILAGTGGGIYLSTNNGSYWSDANKGLTATKINTLAVSGNYIFAGTYNSYGVEGVYISSDNGTNWVLSNNGIPGGISFNAFAINGNNIFAGGIGIYLSTNNGLSWLQSGLTGIIVNSLVVNGNNVFAGTNYGVYLSADNGSTWSLLNNGLPNGISFNALAISENNIFVGGENGIYFSTNNGANWNQASYGLPAYPDNYFISIAASGNNIFAGTFGGGVYFSTDNGSTWASANNGLTGTIVRSIVIHKNNIFAGTSDGGVYVSENNGSSWKQANNGFSNIDIRALAVSNDNNIFVGTYGGGVWFRHEYEMLPVELNSFSAMVNQNIIQLKWKTSAEVNNHGFEIERASNNNSSILDKWETLGFIQGSGNSNSNKEYSFQDISIKGNGKYYYRLKQIDNDGKYKFSNAIEVNFNFLHLVYSLENNFPNPCNPTTVIKYTLPFNSNVKLTVYNALGQTVKELISEIQPVGMHEIMFNGSNLSSGTYLYTLYATSLDGSQNFIGTKKMVLLK